MSNHYDSLLRPIYINRMRLKNRMIMSPMGTFTPMKDGTDSEEGIRYYEERARGGAAMIQTGAMFTCTMLAQGSPTIAVDSIRSIPKQTVMIERCHRWGAKVSLQLSAGTGRNGVLTGFKGERLISASEVPAFYDPSMICRAMTREEIAQNLKDWEICTKNAVMAGYDAIEVHAHAGYLIDQFMSPLWNKRTDEYGGSLENRCRYACEIVQTIRAAAGPDFPILYRISLDHRFNGGRTLKESGQILPILEAAGVDAFDVDAGSYETMDYIFPTVYNGEGCMAYVCEEARKYTKKPIINTGSHSMETAVDLLESGNADIIQFGRQFIADPHFPNKLQDGHREDIRPCLICNEECIGRIFGRQTQLSCAVNPSAGLEDYLQITKLKKPHRVTVIGAGPGGLEAARAAALRGCRVALYEKTDRLGGTFGAIATASWKKRLRDLVEWYGIQLKKLNVQIHLNTAITADDPALVEADEIFAAVGAVPFVPPIPGRDLPNVVDVTEAHRSGVTGQKIVICGGGYSGCDSALELREAGKDVTIVEMMGDVAREAMPINKMSIDRLLKERSVIVLLNTRVETIRADGVVVTDQNGAESTLPADTVITAFGTRPNRTLVDTLEEKYPEKLVIIGDCNKVGKTSNAIRGGYYAALALR